MDNTSIQQEPHTSRVDDIDWKLLDNNLLADPDEYFKNFPNASELDDAQSLGPSCGAGSSFVHGINWEELGQDQFPAQPSVPIRGVVQKLYMSPVETVTPLMLSTPEAFVTTGTLSNIMLEDNLMSFEDPGIYFPSDYSYPNFLESAVGVQEPCFNPSQNVNTSQSLNVAEDPANILPPELDFDTFGFHDPGFSAPIISPLNMRHHGSPAPMRFRHQSLTPSLMQHFATMKHPNTIQDLPFAGGGEYQPYQTPSNNIDSTYASATSNQQMYNTSLNYINYAQSGNVHYEAQSMPTPSSYYSPSLQSPSLQHVVHDSFSPSEDVDSGSSSASDDDSRPRPFRRVPTGKNSKEKPTIPKDKPWIRINKETRGGTSRTLKINNYNPDEIYEQLAHPIGAWSIPHGRCKFEYSQHHELKELGMSTSRLKQFIQYHPKTHDCKLMLYIQRTPADSKRRYASSQAERCMFADCPARIYGKSVASRGLITTGNYRVAFDEFSYRYGADKGGRADPFKVAFVVHLYCLERFLDFPALCRMENISVEADSRQAMPTEPNAKFAAALIGPELTIAASFINACRSGNLRSPNGEWSNYPHHTTIGKEIRWKDHYDTLNYRMQSSKNRNRSSKVQRQEKLTNITMHCGNLDVVHKAMIDTYKTPKDVPGWRYTDAQGVFTGKRNSPPEGWILDPVEPVKPQGPRQKRQVEEVDTDDEDEHNNKMAKTGEHQYTIPRSHYNAGMNSGCSTRQDTRYTLKGN